METREIVERILKLERECKKRAGGNKLSMYNSGGAVHLKQLAFHQCDKRNRWVFGGNRSGKTECGAAEAVYLARGCHPYRPNKDSVSGWVVSLSQQVQRDVAQSKILSYLNPAWIEDIVMVSGSRDNPASGIIDFLTVRNKSGGLSRIGFKSCDQGREKFQGTSLDFVWFDEEPPREVYEECRMRVLDKKGDIFGTMTPLKGLTWVYDEIYLNLSGDDDVWHISMEWADNPYLDQDEVEKLSKALTKSELDARRYGKFQNHKGMVYPEFDEAVHVIEPFDVPREWYDRISIDPGLNNPLSAHWYAINGDGVVFVVAEHYEAGKSVDYHSRVIKAQSEVLKWHTDSKGRIEALIDSASTQRTLAADKSVAELFFDNGICVNTRVNKSLFAGISTVRRYLTGEGGKPKLFIFNTCRNLIREIKSYWWGAGDVPIKKDDHALDDLRYYIMSRPEAHKPDVPKSLIERDKERKIRALKYRQ